MKIKKSLVAVLLMVVLTTTLTGCNGGKEKSSEQTEVTGDAVYGGSIVVGITQDLDGLDPHKAVSAGTSEVLNNVFEGLEKVDTDGTLKPAIASKYKVSDDQLTYTFTIRDGVKFHNGKDVTADDVVYSIKRCAGLLSEEEEDGVKVVSGLSLVTDVAASDDHTVEVTLSEPFSELIYYMTFAIIPADYDKQDTYPIGTGPFKFVSYEPLGSFVMEKNEDYYVAGVPYLDQVTFKIAASADAAFSEILSGAIDIFPYLTQNQVSQLTNQYEVKVGSSNIIQALYLNNAVEPFINPLVRQALCYAIDRQAVVDMLFGGNGEIIGTNMFPNYKDYYNADLVNTYSYDIDKAKELLTQAGYPDGFTFTITVPSNYQPHVDTAQVLVDQLSKVGITAKIQTVEWANWLSDVYTNRNFDATVVGLAADYIAPGSVLLRYNSDSSKNFLNYKNSEFDTIYKDAIKESDQNKKIEDFKKLQELLTNDAASVYIQDAASLVAVNKNLGGYEFYPIYFQDMSKVYYIGEVQNH